MNHKLRNKIKPSYHQKHFGENPHTQKMAK